MRWASIPFLLIRGGTSRAPYFLRRDLPQDRATLAEALLDVIGAGTPGNIDGLGGGSAVTCKVAILSPSAEPDTDVDYLFAQVISSERRVDFSPTCGNILAGVGPAAIELGLVERRAGSTRVRIRAVNTGARIEADVPTPDDGVDYAPPGAVVPGAVGVPAIRLSFSDVVGSKTGQLLPTGQPIDEIDGVEVSCVDAAMPMVVARAADLGITGCESKAELDAQRPFFARLEAIRLEAGRRMGLGDVAHSVIPKFAVLAPPHAGGTVTSRYFMPWDCHPSYAVTGGICLTACLLAPGTVARTILPQPAGPKTTIRIEHPSGTLDVVAEFAIRDGALDLRRAGVLRTARKLAAGEVFVPAKLG